MILRKSRAEKVCIIKWMQAERHTPKDPSSGTAVSQRSPEGSDWLASAPPTATSPFVRDPSQEAARRAEPHSVEQRLRTLVELAPIAIWVAEGDQVTFANRAAGKLMGTASGADLVGQSIYTLVKAESHAQLREQLMHALQHEGEFGRLQARLSHQGREREVEIALTALPDHERTTVQMVISDVSQRNRELRESEGSRQLSRRLSANVVEAREEERRRIARELHDELGQSLSALKMDIADCARSGELQEANGHVAMLLARLDQIVQSVRRIAADLRPLMLDDLGLGDAIEWLANDFSKRLGIPVHLQVDAIEPPPSDKVSIAIYRMVQEALVNVARHSQASKVQVALHVEAGELVLSVRDDGVGLPDPPSQRESQFGLLGIQERADALGGQLELNNAGNGGACVVVRMPLAGEAANRRTPGQARGPGGARP
ncbi:PAS domain-containing sensor histidine kinase [Ideonella azotifigens]|uniref:PAS domain S-box protein n=1 Tax=Ideonella azotifigens TaxID=513160 RepID=A0ABN1KHE1_9BURK|nr:PAS domain-containing sensor histidine kinase [Ideonella azotifigens]MCD2344233.1 PAS domain-containing sensor histidine kinase [Ideonella azotifigens]